MQWGQHPILIGSHAPALHGYTFNISVVGVRYRSSTCYLLQPCSPTGTHICQHIKLVIYRIWDQPAPLTSSKPYRIWVHVVQLSTMTMPILGSKSIHVVAHQCQTVITMQNKYYYTIMNENSKGHVIQTTYAMDAQS